MTHPNLDIPEKPDIYLRQISLDDIGPLYDFIVDNRRHLEDYQMWAADATAESTAERVKFNVARIQKNDFLQFRIISKLETKYSGIIGTITFHNKQKNSPTVLMGYWIGESYQGKGYATAAVNRAVDYVFEEWGMEYIVLEIVPENIRSETLAERIGAWPTGVLSNLDADQRERKSKVWVITKP